MPELNFRINTEKNSPKEFFHKYFGEQKEINSFKILGAVFVAIFLFHSFFLSPPTNFPTKKIIQIEDGLTLSEIAGELESKSLIKSEFWFKTFAYLLGNQSRLISGGYFFNKKIGTLNVLTRLSSGDYGVSPTKVTIPEGFTVVEIAEALSNKFEDFDEEKFLKLALSREGFLFPDTYKFLPNVAPEEVISIMELNFKEKTESLITEIKERGLTLEEIVIMASILEEEARTRETREIISGILWTRIKIGMPLQVDAVFPYIIGKNTFELTLEDLKVDSPYNTYTNLGLPPGAISNPGLSSIMAALRPASSDDLFYLTGHDGIMRYSVTFAGHLRNKAIYLK